MTLSNVASISRLVSTKFAFLGVGFSVAATALYYMTENITWVILTSVALFLLSLQLGVFGNPGEFCYVSTRDQYGIPSYKKPIYPTVSWVATCIDSTWNRPTR